MLEKLKQEVYSKKNLEKAKIYSRFFKTEKGQYGYGDKFLGLTMPQNREISKKYLNLSFEEIQELLKSEYHEFRMIGLLILTYNYKKNKDEIYNFYINNFKSINNWDLVDVTCSQIVGNYLLDKDRSILYKWAKSKYLWTKRISIVSTAAFIKNNQFKDTIKISEILLNDSHDLIHKATGWMLREVGKKDEKELLNFLDTYHKKMPRTMLRYSLEKLSEEKRKHYMKK